MDVWGQVPSMSILPVSSIDVAFETSEDWSFWVIQPAELWLIGLHEINRLCCWLQTLASKDPPPPSVWSPISWGPFSSAQDPTPSRGNDFRTIKGMTKTALAAQCVPTRP